MEKLYSPKTIRNIKDKYGFRLSKSLGQNFLIDGNIVENIVKGAEIGPEDLVIEIGPGIGVLTAAAAERAAYVVAVEIDRNLIPILSETLAEYSNVKIIHGDIMRVNIGDLIRQAESQNGSPFAAVHVLSNLPYYITTPILMMLLEGEGRSLLTGITVMMQKEVADRILAVPGTKSYGALSVAVQYYCTAKLVTNVPKEVFTPTPKVDSVVLRLTLRHEAPVSLLSEKVFFEVVKAGFGHRRKTLLNSLLSLGYLSKDELFQALHLSGIDPQRRAETLSIEEFAALANEVRKHKDGNF